MARASSKEDRTTWAHVRMQYWIGLSTYNNLGRDYWIKDPGRWEWWKPDPDQGYQTWSYIEKELTQEHLQWLRK